MLKKIFKWFRTPLIPSRPQSAPIGIMVIVPLVVIYLNWPLNENTIEFKEVMLVLSMALFLIFCMWLTNWYKSNRNQ